ncbi:MAG: 50S ribosomal protein L35 [Oscillospiraceae bacterium]|nr:50S ribosomal protein L35 [Oscillospiraceae bacterium]
MPKMKTHSGAAKRFTLTKSGKVKRKQAGLRHQHHMKPTKRKRHLRQGAYADVTNEKNVKYLIPYK